MARKTVKGKTWREHCRPFLKKALDAASRSWKPKKKRASEVKRLAKLRAQRAKVNEQIKKVKG
jgi:hypothetical protein